MSAKTKTAEPAQEKSPGRSPQEKPWIVQPVSLCLDCRSPLMQCPSGVVCSRGCGRLMSFGLSESERVINHAALAQLPHFRATKSSKWVIDREGGPRHFVHLSLGMRDVGKRPLKNPGHYRVGLQTGDQGLRVIVVVPEEIFWEEVDAGVRKISPSARRPASFPERARSSFSVGRILDLRYQFERVKGNY